MPSPKLLSLFPSMNLREEEKNSRKKYENALFLDLSARVLYPD